MHADGAHHATSRASRRDAAGPKERSIWFLSPLLVWSILDTTSCTHSSNSFSLQQPGAQMKRALALCRTAHKSSSKAPPQHGATVGLRRARL